MSALTSWLTTTSHLTLTTQIPPSTPPTSVIHTLQDPNITIASSPFITDFRRIEGTAPLDSLDPNSKDGKDTGPSPTIASSFAAALAALRAEQDREGSRGEATGHGNEPATETETETETERETQYFHINEKLPYAPPFAYNAVLVTKEAGFDAIVHAPMGLVITSRYRVVDKTAGIFDGARGKRAAREGGRGEGRGEREGGEGEGEEGMWVIQEDVTLRGNATLMPFVRMNYERGHRKLHADVLEAAGANGGSHLTRLPLTFRLSSQADALDAELTLDTEPTLDAELALELELELELDRDLEARLELSSASKWLKVTLDIAVGVDDDDVKRDPGLALRLGVEADGGLGGNLGVELLLEMDEEDEDEDGAELLTEVDEEDEDGDEDEDDFNDDDEELEDLLEALLEEKWRLEGVGKTGF
ncbi:MAG: hypothetical protein M1828_000725 [Chrysothrix sp. TS-e1954]|nr:MAG: hypothetical protein M1828_000725 [Chrysothrix sp. TS-e1954]